MDKICFKDKMKTKLTTYKQDDLFVKFRETKKYRDLLKISHRGKDAVDLWEKFKEDKKHV